MNEEEFLNFCIKNGLPFEIEFKEPWYPKPIEVSKEDLNNTKRLSINESERPIFKRRQGSGKI